MNKELQLLTTREFNGHILDCYIEPAQEDKGAFWATNEQIGKLLEYEYPAEAIRKIHQRNKSRLSKFSTRVNLTRVEGDRTVTREVIVYNFKGLLEICRYSNQPIANAVIDKLWEIADEIRQTGMYLSKQAEEAYKNNPELFKHMVERCTNLEQKVAEMEKRLNREHPYSVFGHVMLANQGCMSFKDAASFLCQRGLSIGQNRLFKHCRNKKLLCSRPGRQWNKPTQRALEAGLLNVEVNGNFNAITVITPHGMKYLTDELMSEQFPLMALLDGQDE